MSVVIKDTTCLTEKRLDLCFHRHFRPFCCQKIVLVKFWLHPVTIVCLVSRLRLFIKPVSLLTRQKCMYLPIFFLKKVSVVGTVGFYINGAKFDGDRLIPENFVHIMVCLY